MIESQITLWEVQYLHLCVQYLAIFIIRTLRQSDHIKQLPLYFYVFTKKLDTMSKQNKNISAKQLYIIKKVKRNRFNFSAKKTSKFFSQGMEYFLTFSALRIKLGLLRLTCWNKNFIETSIVQEIRFNYKKNYIVTTW